MTNWIQTLKPKSNTHPNDKFKETTQVNNKQRTKNQTSKRGKKNVIYLRKGSGRKTRDDERGTRIKCKIDVKTNKCVYMWETEPSHNMKRWGDTMRRGRKSVSDGERGLV